MTMFDLLYDEIHRLEEEKEKVYAALDKSKDDPNMFGWTVEKMADIRAIEQTIDTINLIVGKATIEGIDLN